MARLLATLLLLVSPWLAVQAFGADATGTADLTPEATYQAGSGDYTGLIQMIQALKAQDNWARVQAAAASGLIEFPYDEQLQIAQNEANEVLSALAWLQAELERPHRLSDPAVRANALKVLSQTRPASLLSDSVAQRRDRLVKATQAYARKVKVEVVSDGLTHIVVKTRGVVGQVERKVIELPPGTYLFEGRRPGFKSKLVKADIDVGETTRTITLVCDERI